MSEMIIQSELVLALHVGLGTADQYQYQCPQRLMNSTQTANSLLAGSVNHQIMAHPFREPSQLDLDLG
jgi:hypothetical protein